MCPVSRSRVCPMYDCPRDATRTVACWARNASMVVCGIRETVAERDPTVRLLL